MTGKELDRYLHILAFFGWKVITDEESVYLSTSYNKELEGVFEKISGSSKNISRNKDGNNIIVIDQEKESITPELLIYVKTITFIYLLLQECRKQENVIGADFVILGVLDKLHVNVQQKK